MEFASWLFFKFIFCSAWQTEWRGSPGPLCVFAPSSGGAVLVHQLWSACCIILNQNQEEFIANFWHIQGFLVRRKAEREDKSVSEGDRTRARGDDLKCWRESNHCSGVCGSFGRDRTFLFWWVTLSDSFSFLTSFILKPIPSSSPFVLFSACLLFLLSSSFAASGSDLQVHQITPGCDSNTILWHYHGTACHRLSNEIRDNKAMMNLLAL